MLQKKGLPKNSTEVRSKEPINKDGYTQDLMLVDKIIGGIIKTKDGRYVQILEIEPVNYINMKNKYKNNIISCFETIVKTGPSRLQLQTISIKSDINDYIENLQKQRHLEKDSRVIKQSIALEKHCQDIASNESKERRFFLIYEYEGRSSNFEEIYDEMNDIKYFIMSEFTKTGNNVIRYPNNMVNEKICEILYNFYNRKTCLEESFSERVLRITSDDRRYNKTETPEHTDIEDFIAPKGIKMITPDTILMDGIYYSYLFMKADFHPANAVGGWLYNFMQLDGVDINVHSKRLDPLKATEKLGYVSRFKEARANDKNGNETAQEEILLSKSAVDYMIDKIKYEGQGIHDVTIMFTVTADSYAQLKSRRNRLQKELRKYHIQTETAYLWSIAAMQMSSPLLHFYNEAFNRNSHNYLSDSLSSLYLYIGCRLYDPKGWLLGANNKDGSIMIVNNFNTNMFANANIAMFGTSGAGKTYAELLIGNHIRLMGIRTIYLYPEKAEEAKKACDEIGGTYIQLHPGSEDCINIMEIRPYQVLDDKYKEDIDFRRASLLAKKVADIKTFTELLMGSNFQMSIEEDSLLDIAITAVYAKYGITTDNRSLYKDAACTVVKDMPIIEELYYETLKEPRLNRISILYKPFVDGSSKNMNQRTNIDLSNEYLVFDCDKNAIGEKLQPAYMFIAFTLIYGFMRESRLKNDTLILDEGWRLLQNPSSAKQVEELVTLIRGYGGSVIFATQRLDKTINGPNSQCGRSIIDNSEIKIILKMKENEIALLDEIMDLTENDKNSILNFERGQAMLFYNSSRLTVDILSSLAELEMFTTDTETLRKIKRASMSQNGQLP